MHLYIKLSGFTLQYETLQHRYTENIDNAINLNKYYKIKESRVIN